MHLCLHWYQSSLGYSLRKQPSFFALGPSGVSRFVFGVSRETPLGPGAKKDGCFRRLLLSGYVVLQPVQGWKFSNGKRIVSARTRIHSGKSQFFESRGEAKRYISFVITVWKWVVQEIGGKITVFDCLSYRDVQTITGLRIRDSIGKFITWEGIPR